MKQVAILLATYRPNRLFLEQQLDSINQQDYSKCHLYVKDDSQSEEWFNVISRIVEERITAFPFTLSANEQNVGSNRTFEKLTHEAHEDYFVYCDQDDVWESNKITRLVQQLEKEKACLCYSDLSVINEKNELICSSFTKYNKRVKHLYGQQVFEHFIRRNSVTGCTMLIKKESAKSALPFHEQYVHDHWLALVSSTQGNIAYVKEPLVRYRIHGNNQIGKAILTTVQTIDDYVPNKLLIEKEKFLSLPERLDLDRQFLKAVEEELRFVNLRIIAFETRSCSSLYALWAVRSKDRMLVYLEILLNLLPKKWSNALLKRMKK
ncbi:MULTISPECIES: glycosyltransferase family 2 protein [unclassified Granulicatella]|uniref:glycosyltransferase family 2 protein n=1 Tax=unclassified Granulicatella TaxID=2630493 RepID=UPI001073EEE4|nr:MULTISPECIES: glycosyltransferase family 2 protein [unclassified Granulicatella]MBF0780879.1 glycosyltransferase family 2 protein [Granulicatella sp. 19428wC4_WM01]TFU93471.1 glycosyltransferase family 2 protein [Granulicatella sp. WM01]